MFTEEQKTKLESAHEMYKNMLSLSSVKAARKGIEPILRNILSDMDNATLLESVMRIFFNNYSMLEILLNSKYCSAVVIGACVRCLNEDITGIDSLLSRRANNLKIIKYWIKSDSRGRCLIEEHALESETLIESISMFSEIPDIEPMEYLKKYTDPLTLKRVLSIIRKYPEFKVADYNRYQLEAIFRNGMCKELLKVIDPVLSAEVIALMGKLIKHYPVREVTKAVSTFKDPDVIWNYFKIKSILGEFKTEREMSIEIAKVINTSLIITIAECPLERSNDLPNYLLEYAISFGKQYNLEQNLDRTIEKVKLLFPFMKGMINQLEGIAPEVSRLWDEELDKRSRAKEEARQLKLYKERQARYTKLIPLAKVAIQNYVDASKEDTSLSAKAFCAKNNITVNTFTKYVNVLKETKDPLYKEYNTISKENTAKLMGAMLTAAKAIVKGLRAKPYKFSMYDYYTITSFDMATIHKNIAEIEMFDERDLSLFRNFWERHRYDAVMYRGWFYNENVIINNREVTKEDKDKVLAYMDSKRYPLIIPIYKKILRNYISGELVL